ncbi:DUF6093 family protein [Cryobacterium psychrophilum]|uniref:Uncharacterized protein n=1 Tax=Cryobacterium psychrophilum TaxID=41988 RepID=A0A4Y8KQS4_9MICO|nr:DUF6093 family protein [Cryobacterium psychrophilum]TFD80539.1 hypothetical protein E3T53_05555 [Cryobacterium psychrophilum]
MTIQSDIKAGQREAEKLMLTTCTITRGGGAPVFNESTGAYDTPAPTTIYAGKCKVRLAGVSVKQVDAASQLLTIQQSILSLPVNRAGTANVAPSDTLTITANPLDLALVGKTFRIEGTHEQTYSTARRYSIERVNS